MIDQRRTPDPAEVTLHQAASIAAPVIDLTRGTNGPRDRQLLYGDAVTVLNRKAGYALVQAQKDGYCGTVSETALGPARHPTHHVTTRATHAYRDADIKTPDLACLSFGVRVVATSETATFIETDLGFLPRQHLRTIDTKATDPAAVAEIFLGTPYLWGGNSSLGIDCSGLVQAACLACEIACPGDSDQQEAELGQALPDASELQRNDLVFWRGHVAMVFDEQTLIHANAGHMAVVYEPIADAIARIETQGDGPPTAFKRLTVA